MKVLHLSLACIASCIMNTVNADVLTANLSQENKHIGIHLNKGDSLSVTYNLQRLPITRGSVWWYYAMWCSTNDKSVIQYNFEGDTKTERLPILLSNSKDGQKVGSDMNVDGIFTITNQSNEAEYISCKLQPKFGS